MFGATRFDVPAGVRPAVAEDWAWANRFMPAVADILSRNALYVVRVRPASACDDLKRATDLVVEVDCGDVAVRVRRPTGHRDLTIRSWRRSGVETELHKILEGWGDWYLYAWVGRREEILGWVLVDLDELRASGLLRGRREIWNRNGDSRFIAIATRELSAEGCLVATSRTGWR